MSDEAKFEAPNLDTADIAIALEGKAVKMGMHYRSVDHSKQLCALIGLEKSCRVIRLLLEGRSYAADEAEEFFEWLFNPGNEMTRQREGKTLRATGVTSPLSPESLGSRGEQDQSLLQESSSTTGM